VNSMGAEWSFVGDKASIAWAGSEFSGEGVSSVRTELISKGTSSTQPGLTKLPKLGLDLILNKEINSFVREDESLNTKYNCL
jgi:hypothetical protein